MPSQLIQKRVTLITVFYLLFYLFERFIFLEYFYSPLITQDLEPFGNYKIAAPLIITQFLTALIVLFCNVSHYLKLEIIFMCFSLITFSLLSQISQLTYHVDAHILKYILFYLIVFKISNFLPKKIRKKNLQLLLILTCVSFLFSGIFKIQDVINSRDFFRETYQYTQFWDIWFLVGTLAKSTFMSTFTSLFSGVVLIFSSLALMVQKWPKFIKFLLYSYGFFALIALESYMALPLLIFIFLNFSIKQEIITTYN